jgi:hypothetical protein
MVFDGEQKARHIQTAYHSPGDSMVKESSGDSKVSRCQILEWTILAQRFAPFNFSVVPGFPNVVPTVDEWGDCLPKFREDRDDNPADHLLEFHEVMYQLGIHHEDVLMKMFMYSLEGEAREWF